MWIWLFFSFMACLLSNASPSLFLSYKHACMHTWLPIST